MDSEDMNSQLTSEQQPLAHIIVEEVPISQNAQVVEHEYNPFLSQSQHLSQAGPSKQGSLAFKGYPTRPLQKRRGRPPKRTVETSVPRRESQRIRKCPQLFNYESFEEHKYPSNWTIRDKRLFLAGCLKVGTEDIAGLKQYLPHKTEGDIKNQIRMWKNLASAKVAKELSVGEDSLSAKTRRIKNLDEWTNFFQETAEQSNSTTVVMSHIFSIIAEYGDFPPPEVVGGVDFRAMYRYLDCMINGLPPYGLDTKTARVLYNCIASVEEKMNDPGLIEEMQERLRQTLSSKPEDWGKRFGKTYGRKVENATANNKPRGLNSPPLNPLNLTDDALSEELKKKLLCEDSDSDSD